MHLLPIISSQPRRSSTGMSSTPGDKGCRNRYFPQVDRGVVTSSQYPPSLVEGVTEPLDRQRHAFDFTWAYIFVHSANRKPTRTGGPRRAGRATSSFAFAQAVWHGCSAEVGCQCGAASHRRGVRLCQRDRRTSAQCPGTAPPTSTASH